MAIKWTWHQDGSVSVHAGKAKKRYKPNGVKTEKVIELYQQLSRHLEISELLATARNSFMKGTADYVNAYDSAANLVDAIDRTQAETGRIIAGVAAFFEPKDLPSLFGDDVKALGKFCDEALQRLKG